MILTKLEFYDNIWKYLLFMNYIVCSNESKIISLCEPQHRNGQKYFW